MRNIENENLKLEMENLRLKIDLIFSRVKGIFYALHSQGKILATGRKLMLVLGLSF